MDFPVVGNGSPVKDDDSPFHCTICDADLMCRVAELLLPSLAAACIDNTTGHPFNGPSSVAVAMRNEMVDYLVARSEAYISEVVMTEEEAHDNHDEDTSEEMTNIISNFVEDFAGLKRNFLSHVSNWLLSDGREDKIDEFVQEMEMSRFWSLERREAVAEALLRNIDLKGLYHCTEKFDSAEKLADHKLCCSFRATNCLNEGCDARISARCMEEHDTVCPFKVLPCEQKCEMCLLRRDMDRHCITSCPMKLVNCPFYQVGCETAFSQNASVRHHAEFLRDHVFYILRHIHKDNTASPDELRNTAEMLEKCDDAGVLLGALSVRSLTSKVKDLEARLQKQREEEKTRSQNNASSLQSP